MNLPSSSDYQELADFFASLLNEQTPRAMIVIGAARLEGETKDIANAVVPDNEGLCRSHGARIDLLCALRHFSKETAECLRNVAKVRNHFAHSWKSCCLSDKEISKPLTALFAILENRVCISHLTSVVFPSLFKKIPVPSSQLAKTLVDPAYQQFHTSILHNHLRIVRCNLPSVGRAIEIAEWEKVDWSSL
jgi:hypothetical protein